MMSEIAQKVALEIRGLSDAVLICLVTASDPDVSRMAAQECARRMIAGALS